MRGKPKTTEGPRANQEDRAGGHPLVDFEEVAANLKVCVRTVHRLVAEGRIPVHRFGRAVRFDMAAVRAATLEPARKRKE